MRTVRKVLQVQTENCWLLKNVLNKNPAALRKRAGGEDEPNNCRCRVSDNHQNFEWRIWISARKGWRYIFLKSLERWFKGLVRPPETERWCPVGSKVVAIVYVKQSFMNRYRKLYGDGDYNDDRWDKWDFPATCVNSAVVMLHILTVK